MSVNVIDNLTVNVNATLLVGAEFNCEIGDQSTPIRFANVPLYIIIAWKWSCHRGGQFRCPPYIVGHCRIPLLKWWSMKMLTLHWWSLQNLWPPISQKHSLLTTNSPNIIMVSVNTSLTLVIMVKIPLLLIVNGRKPPIITVIGKRAPIQWCSAVTYLKKNLWKQHRSSLCWLL